jgi:hypothetical protein
MSSIWEDEWEDYELNKYDFEVWLDSINESGDPERDDEYYNKEMDKINKETFSQEIGELADWEAEMMQSAEFPEFRVLGKDYICTYSVN